MLGEVSAAGASRAMQHVRRPPPVSPNQKAFIPGLLCFSLLCSRQDQAVLNGLLAVN